MTDDEHARALYGPLSADKLREMRWAFAADAAAARAGYPPRSTALTTIAFCERRIALIDRLLEARRGLRRGSYVGS